MEPGEPLRTALLAGTLGLLIAASVLSSRASQRVGVPLALVFLAVGMVAGPAGLAGVAAVDHGLAFRLGSVGLALILFDGGLNTPASNVVRCLAPAALLATVGVVATAAVVAVAAMQLGFPPTEAMLIGAIVSPTDAAAVFSVLRGSRLQLRRRLAATLELESGLNDPLAVILTLGLTHALLARSGPSAGLLLEALVQLVVGAVLGLLLGHAGRLLLGRARLPAAGLYPVLTLALALVCYGVPTIAGGSGFLAVYLAAVVLGNGPVPYRAGVLRVHDAVAWFCQVAMFLLLGMLADPSDLANAAVPGLVVGVVLALLARPLAVLPCLLPFRYSRREMAYLAWVGLRGAVPIILASYPVLAGAPGARGVFAVVFFTVALAAVLPGATVRPVTRWLGLEAREPPAPHAVLEIHSTRVLRDDLIAFHIDRASAACGAKIADLPLPLSAAVVLIVRGHDLVAARGGVVLVEGDHVYVFCRPEDLPFVQLIFGQREET